MQKGAGFCVLSTEDIGHQKQKYKRMVKQTKYTIKRIYKLYTQCFNFSNVDITVQVSNMG